MARQVSANQSAKPSAGRLEGQERAQAGSLRPGSKRSPKPSNSPKVTNSADRQEGDQLDDRFEGDRRDHALVMLAGVDVAGAEQDANAARSSATKQARSVAARHGAAAG